MGRRLAIIGAVVLAFVLGGAALVQLAGSGATAFRLEGQVLHLSGPVNGAAADRLQRMMEENPQITVIALGDMPGADDVVWAAQMGGLIRAAGVAHADSGCRRQRCDLAFLGRGRAQAGGRHVSLAVGRHAAPHGGGRGRQYRR